MNPASVWVDGATWRAEWRSARKGRVQIRRDDFNELLDDLRERGCARVQVQMELFAAEAVRWVEARQTGAN